MWLPEREEKEVSSRCDTKCQSNLMLIGQGELNDDDLRFRSGASEGSRSLTRPPTPHPLLLSDNVLIKMLMRFPTEGDLTPRPPQTPPAANATCRRRPPPLLSSSPFQVLLQVCRRRIFFRHLRSLPFFHSYAVALFSLPPHRALASLFRRAAEPTSQRPHLK